MRDSRGEALHLLTEIRQGATQIRNRCLRAASTSHPPLAEAIMARAESRLAVLRDETWECIALHGNGKLNDHVPDTAKLYLRQAGDIVQKIRAHLAGRETHEP